MFGRSVSNYNNDFMPRSRTSNQVPELFHQISLDDALSTVIPVMRVRKSLGWIARNRPFLLENLMDTTEPGTREFSAICMVYEAFERRVKTVTGNRNRDLQQLTKQGLRESRIRRGTYRARLSMMGRNALSRQIA